MKPIYVASIVSSIIIFICGLILYFTVDKEMVDGQPKNSARQSALAVIWTSAAMGVFMGFVLYSEYINEGGLQAAYSAYQQ